MKKFVTIMLILAVAISGLLFVSCKKEEKKVEEKKVEQKEPPIEKKTAEQLLQEEKNAEKKKEEKKLEDKALVQEEEWKKLRNNESKYLGSVITWEIEVWRVETFTGMLDIRQCNVYGWLGGHSNRGVEIILYPVHFDDEGLSYDKLPELHDNDWIIVTGSFEGVSGDGDILLEPKAVINEGVK